MPLIILAARTPSRSSEALCLYGGGRVTNTGACRLQTPPLPCILSAAIWNNNVTHSGSRLAVHLGRRRIPHRAGAGCYHTIGVTPRIGLWGVSAEFEVPRPRRRIYRRLAFRRWPQLHDELGSWVHRARPGALRPLVYGSGTLGDRLACAILGRPVVRQAIHHGGDAPSTNGVAS